MQGTIEQAMLVAVKHHQAGRLAEAEGMYRQILARRPTHPFATHLLGTIAFQTGRRGEGEELIRKAIVIDPKQAFFHRALANVLHETGRTDEALEEYGEALRLRPAYPDVLNDMGVVLGEKERFEEAIANYRRAIELKPDYAEAHSNLAQALTGMRRIDEAIASCQEALRLNPKLAEALSNLGNLLLRRGLLEESIAACQEAIRLKPGLHRAHTNLGNALLRTGRFDEAAANYRESIRLKPDFAEAYDRLGAALNHKGEYDEVIAVLHHAVSLNPDSAIFHSHLVFTLHYHPDQDPRSIFAEHCVWSAQHALPLAAEIKPHANDRSPERRLRIGYVSGDFCSHSVAFFLLPLLQHHDPEHFEIFGYSNVSNVDATTDRMKSYCKVWRDIAGSDDEAMVSLIRSDRIDILVDLSGHTNRNRLLVFARKPAPIQVTYLGYPDTTGLSVIDYRLTDALADPPGMTDDQNVEKLWRLPECNWCYQPRSDAPEIRPRSTGPVIFGCFGPLAKINSPLVELWAKLLHRVSESQLLLKSAGVGLASSQQRLREQFAAHGIPSDRLELLGPVDDERRHLELYQRIDVALDTYPYHGTTTTCEALWMGIPVVSLAGRTHISRVGVSILTNVGLSELVAQTSEEYVRIAADLAGDPSRLSHLRSTLRGQMENSLLMDARRFARDVESAYRAMWKKWCVRAE